MYTFELAEIDAPIASSPHVTSVKFSIPRWHEKDGVCEVTIVDNGGSHTSSIYGIDPLHALYCAVRFVEARYGARDETSSTYQWPNGHKFVRVRPESRG